MSKFEIAHEILTKLGAGRLGRVVAEYFQEARFFGVGLVVYLDILLFAVPGVIPLAIALNLRKQLKSERAARTSAAATSLADRQQAE